MATSTAQTIPLVEVYDYELLPGDPSVASTSKGKSGVRVKATLQYDKSLTIAPDPVVWAAADTVYATLTDGNGFWHLFLIPNNKISPANTYYTIEVEGGRSYKIQLTDVGVPAPGWQSSAPGILLDIPAALAPTTSVVGAITATGLITAQAGLNVSGGGATIVGGLTVSGGEVETGGLTVDSLTFSSAVGQIHPGATSLSLRNNANNADNLIVTDAGNVTIRGSLTVTTGPTTLSGGDLIVANRIIAGSLPPAWAGLAGDILANRGGASPGTGAVLFGSSVAGLHYLYYDGAKFQLTDQLNVLAGGAVISGGGTLTVTGEVSAPDFKATGVAALGNARAGRFVGAWTTFGPPTGLTAALDDYGFDGQFTLWVCTTAGSPGTWQTGRSRFRMRAHPSAATSVTSADVQITLGTVDYDPNGNFASSTYTVPVAGYYLVIGNLSLAAATDLLAATAKIYKNGTLFATGNMSQGNGTVGPHSQVVVADVFAATDTIALFGSASSTTNNQTLSDANFLQIMYLGS